MAGCSAGDRLRNQAPPTAAHLHNNLPAREAVLDSISTLTINWNRSLIIDSTIDDQLVKTLTPKILELRAQSSDPITIGINSPGGSLASLDVLLGLLTGPDQNGNKVSIITVATHRAYSAAANFLAFGDYSVAQRHSTVIYHDVRYGKIEDVTPEKARGTARSLQAANDRFSLRLAHVIIKRLIWIYIDLRSEFETIKTKFPKTYKKYTAIVEAFAPPVDAHKSVDLACFATSLWAGLSAQNDELISNVMERLSRWVYLTSIVKNVPSYRAKGSRLPGLLDGSRHLHKLFSGRPEHFDSCEPGLKLFLSLVIAEISATKTERINFSSVLERATRDFAILDSMNDPKHIRHATDLMLSHKHIFLPGESDLALAGRPEAERVKILATAAPYATLLWHFCVLLCRELFEGEHTLKPHDAQLLGLVDEVTGGGPVESRRDFKLAQAKMEAEAKAPEDAE
jgi:ATP-dependent protease ClpP protease subunit